MTPSHAAGLSALEPISTVLCPWRLLSLADMIKSDVARLARTLGMFRRFYAVERQRAANDNNSFPPEDFKKTMLSNIETAKADFETYGLLTSLDRVRQFEGYLRTIPNYPSRDIVVDCDEVVRSAESELSRCYFGFVEARKATEIIEADNLWNKVWLKFPSCERDARQAAGSYAVSLDDASVFHSMMVLERGLDALARKLGVKAKARAWQGIIDDIEAEIDKRRKAIKAKKPSDFLTFLSIAAKEFIYFKDAWRNHTAHGRAQYDENDSRKVLTHVRDFMEHLSTRLKERIK